MPQNDKMDLGYESEVKWLPEKKKMGRPTDNPKGISTHVRLDAECNTILDAYCKQTQVPRTEAIRRGIKKLKDDLKKWKEAARNPSKQQPLPVPTTARRRIAA